MAKPDTIIECKSGIKNFLKQMTGLVRSINRKNGWKYSCIEEFVLKNGKAFSGFEKVKRGRQKECFKNAFYLADYNPDLQYVEGYATFSNIGLPVLHAWCVKDGKVYDPTWKNGNEYFGVVFDLSYVRKTILARKRFGVIDNFEHQFPLLSGKETI